MHGIVRISSQIIWVSAHHDNLRGKKMLDCLAREICRSPRLQSDSGYSSPNPNTIPNTEPKLQQSGDVFSLLCVTDIWGVTILQSHGCSIMYFAMKSDVSRRPMLNAVGVSNLLPFWLDWSLQFAQRHTYQAKVVTYGIVCISPQIICFSPHHDKLRDKKMSDCLAREICKSSLFQSDSGYCNPHPNTESKLQQSGYVSSLLCVTDIWGVKILQSHRCPIMYFAMKSDVESP